MTRQKISDGELLLSCILSKSIQDWDKSGMNKNRRIKEFVNQYYHNREEVRSKDSIKTMIYSAVNKPRIKSKNRKVKSSTIKR